MENFMDLLNEDKGLDKEILCIALGIAHKKMCEDKLIPDVCKDAFELIFEMARNDNIHPDYTLALNEMCDEYLDDIDDDKLDEWTINDTKILKEECPWCFDEKDDIIEEEFNVLFEMDYDNDGEDDDKLDAASKKKIVKAMKNPKNGKSYSIDKKYDRHSGLSKEQIKGGFIRCPPGTPAAGKVRKKGKCGKKVDIALSRKLKKAAKQNIGKRKQAAKKAARTRKKLAGRRRQD